MQFLYFSPVGFFRFTISLNGCLDVISMCAGATNQKTFLPHFNVNDFTIFRQKPRKFLTVSLIEEVYLILNILMCKASSCLLLQ